MVEVIGLVIAGLGALTGVAGLTLSRLDRRRQDRILRAEYERRRAEAAPLIADPTEVRREMARIRQEMLERSDRRSIGASRPGCMPGFGSIGWPLTLIGIIAIVGGLLLWVT